MLFRIFRKTYRTVGLIVVLLALTLYLKHEYPGIGAAVGGWISGLKDTRLAQAFSSMLGELSDGHGLASSVEVFYDCLQASDPA